MRKLTEKQKKFGAGAILIGALGLGILVPWLLKRRNENGGFGLPMLTGRSSGGSGSGGRSSRNPHVPASVTPGAALSTPIYFDTGADTYPTVYSPHLAALGANSHGVTYQVTGYASPGGGSSANQRISQARAESVAETLRRYGAEAVVAGAGETSQWGDGAQNQRVMITVAEGAPAAGTLRGWGYRR